ncbi:MAG: O-antigen ligase family protein, partial [Paraglaciecola chathamensis]
NRAVHSSWFEALSEAGYLGFIVFILIIFTSFTMLRRSKAELAAPEFLDDYFKVVCIESMLISYLVAMTFLNRMRSEIFLWCILFIACAYNIYYLRKLHLTQKQ